MRESHPPRLASRATGKTATSLISERQVTWSSRGWLNHCTASGDVNKSTVLQDGEPGGESARWKGAVGNIENARVALDTLARAINDAVYLDEDAYNQVAPIMQYQKTIQVAEYEHVVNGQHQC